MVVLEYEEKVQRETARTTQLQEELARETARTDLNIDAYRRVRIASIIVGSRR